MSAILRRRLKALRRLSLITNTSLLKKKKKKSKNTAYIRRLASAVMSRALRRIAFGMLGTRIVV